MFGTIVAPGMIDPAADFWIGYDDWEMYPGDPHAFRFYVNAAVWVRDHSCVMFPRNWEVS